MLVGTTRLARLATFAALLTLVATPLAAQTSGSFDPGYGGGDGIRLFEPNIVATGAAVGGAAVRADGTLWIGGSVLQGDFDTFVCRMSPGGGAEACVTLPIDLSPSATDHIHDVAVDAAGNAVVVGQAGGPPGDTDSRALFMRVTNSPALDATFAGDGIVDDFDLTVPFVAQAVALQPNGRIVWAGYVDQQPLGIPDRNMIVGRLLANGSLDSSFDGDGYRLVVLNTGGNLVDDATDVAVQPDGKIVIVGSTAVGPSNGADADYAVIRLNADGSFDNSFSGDGKVLIDVDDDFGLPDSGGTVAIDRFGRMVVAGLAGGFGNGVCVVRLLPGGELDPSFGAGGTKEFSIVEPGDPRRAPKVLLLPGDAIGVVGDFDPDVGGDTTDSYLAVLEPDGDLDPTFGGGDGKVTFSGVPEMTDPAPSFAGAAVFGGRVLVAGDGGFEQSDLAFALRLWMRGLFRDDFETGNAKQWSATTGN